MRARKASLFFDDLIDWLMTAQIRGQDLDLPKLGVKGSVKWRHVSGSRDQ